MNKVLKIASVAVLSAVVAASAAVSASAAGLNDAENKILAELRTTTPMAGVEKSLPSRYINQAENYFNGIEITDEQATQIIAKIEEIKAYLTSTGKPNTKSLSDDEIAKVVAMSNEAVGYINCTLTYDRATGDVTVTPKGSSGGGSGTGVVIDTKDTDVKNTGFGLPEVTAVAGVGLLCVTAAGVYLLRTSKKEESC